MKQRGNLKKDWTPLKIIINTINYNPTKYIYTINILYAGMIQDIPAYKTNKL